MNENEQTYSSAVSLESFVFFFVDSSLRVALGEAVTGTVALVVVTGFPPTSVKWPAPTRRTHL